MYAEYCCIVVWTERTVNRKDSVMGEKYLRMAFHTGTGFVKRKR